MTSINFKGKTAVWNHHLSVPYHTLEKDEKNSLEGKNDAENLIIEGDNLLALKALLPKYQGRVKCIYIDPPYNTGDEGWIYSDNVNNPIIKSWIGDVVGKDDLVRHDKWLCLMTPRLRLLHELLHEQGLIFISVDSNEVHRLKCLMDEIFGIERFVGDFQWKKKSTSTNVEGAQVSSLTDYTLCYAKTEQGKIKPRIKYSHTRSYPHSDAEGDYRLAIIEKKNSGAYRRDSMRFEILGQRPREGKRWQLGEETARLLEAQNRFIIEDGIVKRKIYSSEDHDSTSAQPLLLVLEDVGTTVSGGKELEELFGVEGLFDNPKPSELIEHLVNIVCDDDDIILDSFAGSGTTGHAVLNLNRKGGNRKFILVQIPEKITENKQAFTEGYRWVHEITRDRVKKVIKQDGLDVGFTYYTLGPDIDGKKMLSGKNMPAWDVMAKYVHFLATGRPIDEVTIAKKTWEISDAKKGTGVYLIYASTLEELKKLAITRDWLEAVKDKEGKKIVYAPACFLDKEILDEYNISFVQVPFNLFTRK